MIETYIRLTSLKDSFYHVHMKGITDKRHKWNIIIYNKYVKYKLLFGQLRFYYWIYFGGTTLEITVETNS